jgi:serine-type D-Ala-D-Ala carboxypeptidase (penicillin-binding protein 5/6)
MRTSETRYKTQDTKGRTPPWIAFLSLASCILSLPSWASDPPPPSPTLNAKSWVLIDYDSARVLAEHDADTPLAAASLAKLMVAYVLFEKIDLGAIKPGETVTIGEAAARARGAKLFLRVGETVPMETLIQGMIVHSANDATIALAERAGGGETAFVAEMNATARRLGMARTHFTNVTGHDQDGQQTSARDAARLTSALIRRFPDGYRRFSAREVEYRGLRHYNRNALLWRDATVDGVNTGQTRAAGFCAVVSAQRQHMRLIAAVLGGQEDSTRFDGARALLDYGFRHFETHMVHQARSPLTKTRVWLGDAVQVDLGPARDLYATLQRGASARLATRYELSERLTAPVREGQLAGTLVVELDGHRVGEAPLIALQAVAPGNALQRTLDRLQWLVQ